MPFLRFNRDKRGYETTALMHAFDGRGQPRVLYWFRGPVSAKVGRAALDEEAIRLLEEHYPRISFEWTEILESRAGAETETRDPRDVDTPERRGPSRARRGAAERERRPAREPDGSAAGPAEPETPADIEKSPRGLQRDRRRRRQGRGEPSRPAGRRDVLDAETPAARAAEAVGSPRTTAAEETFSPEDLTRLRARHAALLARIDRDAADEPAAEDLREAAEGLNPDTWVTPEDVSAALERYEATYRRVQDALRVHTRQPQA